jgi:hypothetical protein
MTGWVGDPTTGATGLPSPQSPHGWSLAAGSAEKAPSYFIGAHYALENALLTSWDVVLQSLSRTYQVPPTA